MGTVCSSAVAALIALACSGRTLAQESPSPAPQATPVQPTPQQQAAYQQAIVKLSQNPVGNIAAIPFQNNFNFGVGPYSRYQYNLNLQPVVPFMLGSRLNLVARTIIPVVDQPSFAAPNVCGSSGCGSTFGIGDVQEQLFFAPKVAAGALIWGAGPIVQVPSAQPQDVLGSGKWSAGPALVGLVMPGRWVVGMLVTQLWSVAGRSDRAEVNAGLFNPFVNYNLPGGWALSTSPAINVNYAAPGDQKWSVPLGGGISKTFKLGDQLMQLGLSYYTYVARPIAAPQTTLRVQWSLLYPIKRGVDMADILNESSPR